MTIETKHKKHSKIPRRESGQYGANEIALVGTTCDKIQKLSRKLIKVLSSSFEMAYIDADHASFDNPQKGEFVEEGAAMYLSNKQVSVQLQTTSLSDSFDNRLAFNHCDVALINGNHTAGNAQIVFLDSSKLKSLEKRIEQLTNVLCIVKVDDIDMPDFLPSAIPNISEVPMFDFNTEAEIITFVSNWLEQRKPKLKALVLAGGKSTRMGTDKAQLKYDNQRQVDRVIDLLKNHSDEVYVSCRLDQDLEVSVPVILDRVEDMGPLGAITTAFRNDPNAAWLVVACDLPLLDNSVIKELINQRSIKHYATAFLNHSTGFAEPLITIWEPKSYMRMLQFESLGYTCPRKVLINSNTNLITPKFPEKLTNVNTPEDFKSALSALNK